MKVYMLTEADFEKLDLLFRMLEAEHKDPVSGKVESREDVERAYRFHVYGWVNEVKASK